MNIATLVIVIIILIDQVISQNHVVKRAWDFMGGIPDGR